MLSINTNITSLLAMTSLNKNTNIMNTAMNRLSTGYRINSTKDDAAGSAISASLEKEISSFEVAQDNAQMGQSMIDVASGTLSNIQSMVHRIRDLAEESANGTYGYEERRAMQAEVESLVDEIYRIKETTEFNGKKIFGEEKIEHVNRKEALAQGYKVVNTADELKEVLKAGDLNCKVMLFSDIDLNDLGFDESGSNWTAVGDETESFNGIFDGNNFTISNLKINKPDELRQGLFGQTEGATIKNVNLENVDITGKKFVAGLVSYATGNTIIENCDVSGSVTGTDQSTGGSVGYLKDHSTMENCSFTGSVTGVTATGGLIGYTETSTVENCTMSGTVISIDYTGGLTGYSKGTNRDDATEINNCQVSADIISSDKYIGGISGINYSFTNIENCNFSGSVNGGGLYTGGITGQNNTLSKIINCTSTGTVTGTNRLGGIVGNLQSGQIKDSATTCTVTSRSESTNYVGAFAGYSIGTTNYIKSCEYDSNINGEMLAIGNRANPGTSVTDVPGLVIDPVDLNKTENKAINPVRLQIGTGYDSESVINIDTGFDLGGLSVSVATEYSATKALDKIDALMNKITDKQTELGSVSNRIKSTIEFQQVQRDSKTSMLSVVKDADIAKESSNYIKSQILQQTTASLLAQANQTPSIALRLLSA